MQYVAPEDQLPQHQRWMAEAMAMAQEAIDNNEVPVGCVFVRDDRIIAKARNRTNELRNVMRNRLSSVFFGSLLTSERPSCIGHQTRRTRSHRRDPSRPRTDTKSHSTIPAQHDDSLRDGRAVHNVRLSFAPTGDQRSLRWMWQRPLWGLRKRPQRQRVSRFRGSLLAFSFVIDFGCC